MEPGLELDALISEHVMGWIRDGGIWTQPNGHQRTLEPTSYGQFSPSKDMNDAWEVVEKFKDAGEYKIEISAYPRDSLWTIKAYHRDGASKSCTTSAATLPHAICLAALKASSKRESQDG